MMKWALGSLVASCCLTVAAAEQAKSGRLHKIPLQVILLSDDDGKRQTSVPPGKAQKWVEFANRAFAEAHVQFSYEGTSDDTVKIADTFLNSSFKGTVYDFPKPTKEELLACKRLAARYPGKLTVLVRWGPNAKPTGLCCAPNGANLVVMSSRAGAMILAHEMGHYFGLPHTFVDIPFATVEEAAEHLRKKRNDRGAFDGDGFSDTAPDPAVRTLLRKHEAQRLLDGKVDQLRLNGMEFTLPRSNIMSYYNGESDSFSPQQIERVRWVLGKRLEHQMALPSNQSEVQHPVEVEKLRVLEAHNLSTSVQAMDGFSPVGWSGDKQLLCSGTKGAWVKLPFTSPYEGQCTLHVFLTQAADYAKVRFLVDDKLVGDTIDLYSPIVLPSGRISIPVGELTTGRHTLTCRIVGRNPRSTGDLVGIDCIELQKADPRPPKGELPSKKKPPKDPDKAKKRRKQSGGK